MSKSPGHRKWPDHKVQEQHIGHGMQVIVDGEILADSSDVVRVDEDDQPARYYFPRSDIRMNALERTDTTSECPFKGSAHYFSLKVGDKKLTDAAWTYEEPYEEHVGLKDRIAFYEDKVPSIEVRPQ